MMFFRNLVIVTALAGVAGFVGCGEPAGNGAGGQPPAEKNAPADEAAGSGTTDSDDAAGDQSAGGSGSR